MRNLSTAIITLILITGLLAAPYGQQATAAQKTTENDYPIVLVHGLTGWGRDEMAGFKLGRAEGYRDPSECWRAVCLHSCRWSSI
nr:hypothetical protein [Mesobacillus harenae]